VRELACAAAKNRGHHHRDAQEDARESRRRDQRKSPAVNVGENNSGEKLREVLDLLPLRLAEGIFDHLGIFGKERQDAADGINIEKSDFTSHHVNEKILPNGHGKLGADARPKETVEKAADG